MLAVALVMLAVPAQVAEPPAAGELAPPAATGHLLPAGEAVDSKARLLAQKQQLELERPSLRLPVLLTTAALLSLGLGLGLIFDAWGWSKLWPSGAWNQASVRYLTASGSGYALSGLTVSLTGVWLLVKTVRERRQVDLQLEEIERLVQNGEG